MSEYLDLLNDEDEEVRKSAFEKMADWYAENEIPDPIEQAVEQGCAEWVTLCGRSGCENEVDPDNIHTCPYVEDINDDHEFMCHCCETCISICADDV